MIPRRAALLTAVLVASGYALLLCPSLYWLDSGELAAASFELGIAHAPGQPLALLLGKLACFLPIGDVALRAGLAQLVCGAVAAALVAWLGARVAALFCEAPSVQAALGVFAGLLYAGSYAAAFSAIRPEVYALSAALVLGTVVACVRYLDEDRPGLLGIAGLCFGLGLANHHYLTLLGAVPPALALLPRRSSLGRALGLAALGTAVGLLPYLYLPLRAARDPVFDWGHPTTLSSFLWTVSARSFQKSAGLDRADDLPALLGALFDQLTPLAPLLALGGVYLVSRRRPRMGVALVLLLAGPIAARLAVSFDAGNPDAFGYLSTGMAALAILCVPLPAALLVRLPRGRVLVAASLALAAFVLGAVRAPAYALTRFEDTRAIYTPIAADAPAETLIVTSYFQTTFSLDYLRVVEGLRPDLVYLPRHRLDQPGLAKALVRRDPRLAEFLDNKRLDVSAVLATSRPRLVEYDLDLDGRLVEKARLIPVHVPVTETQSRRFLLWQDYLRLHQLCRLGAPPAEVRRQAEALRAQPGARGPVDELLAHCN